ncbi:MAG: porin family protein [Desulfobacteria bacterium]
MLYSLALTGKPAMAEAFRVSARPALALEGVWDTNVFNTAGGDADYLLRARPSLTLSFNIKGTTFRATGGGEGEWYNDHRELNHTSGSNTVDLKPDAPIPITERVQVTPAFLYFESRDIVRRNAIVGGSIASPGPAPLPVTPLSDIKEYRGSLKTAYLVSPKTTVGGEVEWVRQDYSQVTASQNDTDSYRGTVTFDQSVTPRSTLGFSLVASRSVKETTGNNPPGINEFTPSLTGKYRFSDNASVEVNAGMRYLSQSSTLDNNSGGGWTPSGKITFAYTGATLSTYLTGQYEKSAFGNAGFLTERGSVRLGATKQATQRISMDLSGYYSTDRFLFGGNQEDTVGLGGTGTLRYLLAEWMTVRISANGLRQWQHNPVFAFEQFERYSVLLGFDVGREFKIY